MYLVCSPRPFPPKSPNKPEEPHCWAFVGEELGFLKVGCFLTHSVQCRIWSFLFPNAWRKLWFAQKRFSRSGKRQFARISLCSIGINMPPSDTDWWLMQLRADLRAVCQGHLSQRVPSHAGAHHVRPGYVYLCLCGAVCLRSSRFNGPARSFAYYCPEAPDAQEPWFLAVNVCWQGRGRWEKNRRQRNKKHEGRGNGWWTGVEPSWLEAPQSTRCGRFSHLWLVICPCCGVQGFCGSAGLKASASPWGPNSVQSTQ